MEGIEAEIENKSIEKSVVKEEIEAPKPKPKKPRSQAQKEAFEKARKKRAENLAKKKAQELTENEVAEEYEEEVVADIKPPPKRRGRPKKAMKNQEPAPVSFIPPPDPQLYSQYPYPIQNQSIPPYNYWGGVPQQAQAPAPQPAPVNNYYYYGAPPVAEGQRDEEPREQREPEPSPDGSLYSSEEEEYIDYPSTEPQLKYRFA